MFRDIVLPGFTAPRRSSLISTLMVDMFYFSATNRLVKGETIQIFNYGNCKRDFTYIDDIVEGVDRVMRGAPKKETGKDGLPVPPYAVYNIGEKVYRCRI